MNHIEAFNNLVTHILKWEGGYVNDPDDHGGKTNKGVTYNTYQGLVKSVLGVEPSEQHFNSLTDSQVKQFIKHFWDAVKGDSFKSSLVSCFLTEMAWGSGPRTSIKTLQSTLNTYFSKQLTVDGAIGPKTIEAANSVNGEQLFNYLVREREAFLKRLAENPTQQKFLKGWLNRVNDFVNNHSKFIIAGGGALLLVIGVAALYIFTKKN